MIDRNNPIPLYVQLKQEILKNIKEGIWKEGTQIPTEKELMEQHKLGRATVRESISRLVNDGYLLKKHGVGTFVASVRPSLGFEPLISLTSSLEVRGIKSENIIEKEATFTPDNEFMKILRWNTPNLCLYLKRLRYADNIPLAIEESYFSEYIKEHVAKFDLTGSLAKILLEEIGITINKVDQTIIPRMPLKEEQKELKIEEDTVVLELKRWIYINGQEEPFYFVKFIVPADIYTY